LVRKAFTVRTWHFTGLRQSRSGALALVHGVTVPRRLGIFPTIACERGAHPRTAFADPAEA